MSVWQRRVSGLALALACAWAALAARAPAAEELDRARQAASEARMRKDIYFLASDECEGRGPTTQGINKAADYIANEFKKAGLKPGGKDGSWFQPFAVAGAKQTGPARLAFRSPGGRTLELKEGVDFHPQGISDSGKVSAGVVFAGYGITSTPSPARKGGAKDPAPSVNPDYDDYAGLDVEGKVVIVLRDGPRLGTGYAFHGPWQKKFEELSADALAKELAAQAANATNWRRRNGSLQAKMQNAARHKAAAIVFVSDAETAADGDDLMDFNFLAAGAFAPARLPAFHMKRAVLDALLRSATGTSLEETEKAIDRELKPHSAALDGWTAAAEVKLERSKDTIKLKNVVGVIEGKGPLARETVIIGAHYDHLGYGGAFGSLARLKKPAIHHGADDNGSGSTTVMELARRFGRKKDYEGRRLVFMDLSGEEMGLLGSRHYCKEPIYPLADTVAMVNLDMVGRLRPDEKTKKDKLLAYGTGTDKSFDGLLTRLNERYQFDLRKTKGTSMVGGSSDHASFYSAKVPVIFFFTGDHPQYHRPTDTADRINLPGMRKIADLTEELVQHLATVKERPQYVKVDGGRTPGGAGAIPRIGVRPAYGDDGDGMLLDDVNEGGPAARAGLKKGDRVVAVNGKAVKNVEEYFSVMLGLKKGDTVEFTVLRGGKTMAIKVKTE